MHKGQSRKKSQKKTMRGKIGQKSIRRIRESLTKNKSLKEGADRIIKQYGIGRKIDTQTNGTE